jgi:N utilization substance protein A
MINKAFFKNAEVLAEEIGITVEDVYEEFKKGLIISFKKINGNASCEVTIDPGHHEIKMYSLHIVVEKYSEELEEYAMAEMLLEEAQLFKASYKVGDIVKQEVNIKDFNRTPISAAKSVYTQGVRTKQRDLAYEHFKTLENEMVIGEVTNLNDKFITLNLGMGVVTSLSVKELLPNDHPFIGEKMNVYVRKVEMTTKAPKVSVSRTDRALVIRLMDNFIPEIKSGVIEIKGIPRDPGERSKIALYSNDPKVDAIGSCVGEAGSRIRDIVNALGREKVDLYKWSEVPEELISNSLQPANVTKVLSIDPKTKSSVVVVPNDHLSLAIGMSGQNVRLAVQSCGWKIVFMPVTEAYERGLLI